MNTNNLKEIEAEVWKHVESLRNNPQTRLQLTETFYQNMGKEIHPTSMVTESLQFLS